ncbi:RnfABCDGE type electron transport complex subunit D [Bengtsoniella intestinalis]|uniref:RnfABCDGE type electron transport complex subunit D n=1 Tax=Bengtsoniella intestinalis TaxID=3073143 RepID=UPI00391F81C6
MKNDYKALKLIVTSSPHIRSSENTRSIMLDVIIALLPASGFAIWLFGLQALVVMAVSVIGCVAFEWLYRHFMKQPQMVGDLSAVVTGLLLALVCPVSIPLWTLLIGDFFAIVVVKQLFGGIGKNFVNPALAGRAFLVGSYAGSMTTWIYPNGGKFPLFGTAADIVTGASYNGVDVMTGSTPMAYLAANDVASMHYSVADLFIGTIGGSMGEVSALMLLIGGAYLLWRKVITWHIPVAYLGSVAVLALVFNRGNDPIEWMLLNLFGGGVMLGAIFMATDYATSPISKTGQLVFGIGCGVFTVFIRYFGALNEGVCYSIMVMNLLVPLIDAHIRPTRFGVVKAKKEGAAK